MSNVKVRAALVLIEHTRTRIEDCHCGWGVETGAIGQSHALHVAGALADAGLLCDPPSSVEPVAQLERDQQVGDERRGSVGLLDKKGWT
jgi:hypothetical protein